MFVDCGSTKWWKMVCLSSGGRQSSAWERDGGGCDIIITDVFPLFVDMQRKQIIARLAEVATAYLKGGVTAMELQKVANELLFSYAISKQDDDLVFFLTLLDVEKIKRDDVKAVLDYCLADLGGGSSSET